MTAVDGVRERFLIETPDVAGVDHLLSRLFPGVVLAV
jgi:hypothetical protein